MIRIVFIDDDHGSLILFEEICRKEGFEFTGIQNPRNIVSMIPGFRGMNLIFVDLEMPHYNGFEILRLLRDDPTFAAVPIVACTVYGNQLEQARSGGFSSFILKPLNIDRFPDQVRQILAGQQIWETHGS